MIRSMTGFGAAEGLVGRARVSVELRTVNHRFFNPSFKLPEGFARWEGEVRETLRRGIARGHATLVVRQERDSDAGAVDEQRFAATLGLLRRLQREHDITQPVDVATVLQVPDVVLFKSREEAGGTAEELVALVQQALDALTRMREAEGERLVRVLEDRLTVVEQALSRIRDRAPERLVAERERLRRSIAELSAGVAVDEARLVQELAILADKLDVSEELDRFRAHLAAFRDTLRRRDGQPAGKRLSFLLQEMLREANTAGSKARDASMLHDVVAVKEELERLAEQVENLE